MNAEQCRGARAMLKLSRRALARDARVAERTIADFEAERREPIVKTKSAMKRALEAAGIEFATDGRSGIVLAGGRPG